MNSEGVNIKSIRDDSSIVRHPAISELEINLPFNKLLGVTAIAYKHIKIPLFDLTLYEQQILNRDNIML